MKTSFRRSAYCCLTFAAAVAAATATPTLSALAADLPVRARDTAVRTLWTGYYFGVHGGWGWGSTRIDDPLAFTPTFNPIDVKSSGPIAGAQLGVNWQYGNVVYGVELDGSWASLRETRDNPVIGGFSAVNIRGLATGTGRVGYAMGSWLAYAKGGVAWGALQISTGNLGPQIVVYDENRFGATAGAGMEVAFLRNVSAKLEYNVLYFPEHSLPHNTISPTSTFDHYVHLVKGGFNVRFGGDPVVARY
jgi:opacity protein-like surface antigen